MTDKSGDVQGGQEAEDILSLLGSSGGVADANDRCRCKEIRFWWEQYTSGTAGIREERLSLRASVLDPNPWLAQEIKSYPGYLTASEILAKIPKAAREIATDARRICDIRADNYVDFRSPGPVAGEPWSPGKSVSDLHGKSHEKALSKQQRLRTSRSVGKSLVRSARVRYPGRWEKDRGFSIKYQAKARRILGFDPKSELCVLRSDEILLMRRLQREDWWRLAADEFGFIACRFPGKADWADDFPPAAIGYVKSPGGDRAANAWALFSRDRFGSIQVTITGFYSV
tara:strand:- start:134 stop:988 length:855 start_codon:yes stop_codon:yes gene_type:complete